MVVIDMLISLPIKITSNTVGSPDVLHVLNPILGKLSTI